jgi:hypothetical protein
VQLRPRPARANTTQGQGFLAHIVRRQHRAIHHVPRTDRECDEIRRQRLGARKRQRFPLFIVGYLFVRLARVGDRDFIRRHRQDDVERRLEARLVE